MYKTQQEYEVFDQLSDTEDPSSESYIKKEEQPEILSSFLCAQFDSDRGGDGGLFVNVYMEMSANPNLSSDSESPDPFTGLERIRRLYDGGSGTAVSCLSFRINPTDSLSTWTDNG